MNYFKQLSCSENKNKKRLIQTLDIRKIIKIFRMSSDKGEKEEAEFVLSDNLFVLIKPMLKTRCSKNTMIE